MTIDYSKRALFSRNLFSSEQHIPSPLRPPGAVSEDRFIEDCTRCEQCISACPQNVLLKGPGGYPGISFENAECTLCYECIDVCEPQALSRDQLPWQYIASTDSQCLPLKGIACQSCQDSCDQNAIKFSYTKIIPTPEINTELCNACGACVSVCPAKAISIHLPEQREYN